MNDGPIKTCRFHQPVAVWSELDKTLYLCDTRTNVIKIVTLTAERVKFLIVILIAVFNNKIFNSN